MIPRVGLEGVGVPARLFLRWALLGAVLRLYGEMKSTDFDNYLLLVL
jgi:hypothetical protein